MIGTLKIREFVLLLILVLVGSFIGFRGTNYLMSDVANYANGLNFPYIFVSFPAVMLVCIIILWVLYLVRRPMYEEKHRHHLRCTYLIIFGCFSLVGLVTSILTGTVVYKSFLVPYPFTGYSILGLVIYSINIVLFVVFFILERIKRQETDKKKKYGAKHVFYTIGVVLVIFLAFNRFGALMCSPFFIDFKHFDIVWAYLLSLIIPMIFLVIMGLHRTRIVRLTNKQGIIVWTIYLSFSILLMSIVMFVGLRDPLLLALVSPAMPIERLATLPIDFLLLYVVSIVFGIIILINHCKLYHKEKITVRKQDPIKFPKA